MTPNILPPALGAAPHVAAFEDMFAERFAALPLDSVLVYLVDTVSADALPYLAKQFDVAGFKGFALATTDAARRAIIKQAIALKRHMGTVWAIRQALQSVGYGSNANIVEGVGGGPNGWAVFRIEIDLGSVGGITGSTEDELARLINEYKNARSHLESIAFVAYLDDVLTDDGDTLDLAISDPSILDTIDDHPLYYDGTWELNGALNYDNQTDDILHITIV